MLPNLGVTGTGSFAGSTSVSMKSAIYQIVGLTKYSPVQPESFTKNPQSHKDHLAVIFRISMEAESTGTAQEGTQQAHANMSNDDSLQYALNDLNQRATTTNPAPQGYMQGGDYNYQLGTVSTLANAKVC